LFILDETFIFIFTGLFVEGNLDEGGFFSLSVTTGSGDLIEQAIGEPLAVDIGV
jgi:hypothetical protein